MKVKWSKCGEGFNPNVSVSSMFKFSFCSRASGQERSSGPASTLLAPGMRSVITSHHYYTSEVSGCQQYTLFPKSMDTSDSYDRPPIYFQLNSVIYDLPANINIRNT